MRRHSTLLILFIAALLAGKLAASGLPGAVKLDIHPVDEAFQLTVDQRDGVLVVRWFSLPGYYLYRHSLGFSIDGEGIPGADIPGGAGKRDEFFGDVEVYYGELVVKVPLKTAAQAGDLTVTYQGCADAGFCYPPQKRVFKVASGS